MNGQALRATAILIGTTIGAGIFGLPYAIAKVGLWLGVLYLVALGLLVLLLNLLYGELILRTPGDHQLTGYGEIYLGKIGKILATAGLFIGLYGALLAYLIKIGEFAALVSTSTTSVLFSLIFFVFASVAIFFGLKTVSKLELILVSLMLIFIVILVFVGLPHLKLANYEFRITNYGFIFFPYGVILFALTGYSAIPEMEEILRKNHSKLKRAIIFGTLIPIFVYLLFATVIIGITGKQTSDDAISSLRLFLPDWITKLGAGLGILTMSTSFLALGYVLREVWYRDFRLPRRLAFGLAVFPSLILFLSGAKNFIQVLQYTGALTGGLTGILIIFCFWKAKKLGKRQPVYSLKILKLLLFILGIIFVLGMFSFFH